MDTPIDFVQLAQETRFSAVSGILVVNRIVLAAPGDLTSEQKKALRGVAVAKTEVERVREERAMRQPAKVRPFIGPFNASWSGLSDVLGALATLPPDVGGKKSERAQKVRMTLFPEGGAPFLQLDAETAWVEAKERLDRIARHDVGGELALLVGPEHVEAIKKTTAALGEILGVGKTPRPAPSSTAMQDALKALSRAVARYARKLLADVDDEEPSSVERFMRALGPLAEHKASLRTRGPSLEEEDPAEPVVVGPEPTPEPVV